MREEIEDLHALADECREWARTSDRESFLEQEFLRLAKQLDEIAKRLAEKEP
ncbi:MAG: hypothetical protein ABWY64_16960 [Tardiphaga sp.]